MEITTIISNPSLQPTEISPLKNPKDPRFWINRNNYHFLKNLS
jgi:hypothetical protein